MPPSSAASFGGVISSTNSTKWPKTCSSPRASTSQNASAKRPRPLGSAKHSRRAAPACSTSGARRRPCRPCTAEQLSRTRKTKRQAQPKPQNPAPTMTSRPCGLAKLPRLICRLPPRRSAASWAPSRTALPTSSISIPTGHAKTPSRACAKRSSMYVYATHTQATGSYRIHGPGPRVHKQDDPGISRSVPAHQGARHQAAHARSCTHAACLLLQEPRCMARSSRSDRAHRRRHLGAHARGASLCLHPRSNLTCSITACVAFFFSHVSATSTSAGRVHI